MFVILMAMGLVSFSTTAAATHSGGVEPPNDFVVGSIRFAPFDADIHINAVSGPSGEEARGGFFYRQGPVEFRGEVTCLRTIANRAVAGGRIETSNVPALEGRGFLQHVEDNGEPGLTDRSRTEFLPVPPPECPLPISALFQRTQGNYVVHDGQP
ncbi:MAG: hypothetical protein M3346_04395 [Actinomycetota bacterium]|nr:hypothetical protein [Actinomycetota bacterium]